ncbi:hypothetical protein ACFQT0_04535 [Hymenobacter humi]|uniref:Uncharacterized protein n=1 Tax=Hymenobacter humi TaxID=1411620 RepID=A0ABW2U1Q5_9BACT
MKVDRETEYSIGYRNTLLQVSNSKINKLHVHGWALLSGPQAKAVIVVQITDPAKGGEKVYWQALDIRGEVKTLNHWTEIDKDFDLPDTIARARSCRCTCGAPAPTTPPTSTTWKSRKIKPAPPSLTAVAQRGNWAGCLHSVLALRKK